MPTVIFYETENGAIPVKKFLDDLVPKQAQKVAWVLQIIQEKKHPPVQYFKKLVNTDEIWEARIQISGDIFRILGFMDTEEIIVLTNGFAKKTQKTPQQEIELAESRKKDYFARKT